MLAYLLDKSQAIHTSGKMLGLDSREGNSPAEMVCGGSTLQMVTGAGHSGIDVNA